jgi:hypothetical protein
VSCERARGFDWNRLREQSDAAESLRDELRPHLRTCVECRRTALRVDPTLAFGSLPAVDVSAAELREMQQRVAGARRLLESGSRDSAAPRPWFSRSGGRAAAAALFLPALVLAGLSGIWSGMDGPTETAGIGAPTPIAQAAASEELDTRDGIAQRLDGLPLVEPAEDGAPEIVYQVQGASFDLVLLVDEGLELGGP